MTHTWYVIRDNRRFGPMVLAQLQQAADRGQLRPTDLVWHEGMAQPVVAQQVSGLRLAPQAPTTSVLPPSVSGAAGANGKPNRAWVLPTVIVTGAFLVLILLVTAIIAPRHGTSAPKAVAMVDPSPSPAESEIRAPTTSNDGPAVATGQSVGESGPVAFLSNFWATNDLMAPLNLSDFKKLHPKARLAESLSAIGLTTYEEGNVIDGTDTFGFVDDGTLAYKLNLFFGTPKAISDSQKQLIDELTTALGSPESRPPNDKDKALGVHEIYSWDLLEQDLAINVNVFTKDAVHTLRTVVSRRSLMAELALRRKRLRENPVLGFSDQEWQEIVQIVRRRGLGENADKFRPLLLLMKSVLIQDGKLSSPTVTQIFKTLDIFASGALRQMPIERVEDKVRTTINMARSAGFPVITPEQARGL